MKCNDYLLLLSGHIDGMNTQQEEKNLQKHLQSCGSCRALLDEMIKNDSVLRSDQIAVPPDLTEKVMAEVRKTKKNKRPFYISLAASALAAAAVLAVAFSGKITPPAGQMQQTLTATALDQETELKLPLRHITSPEPAEEDFEFVTDNDDVWYDYAGVGKFPESSSKQDELKVAAVVDEVSVLVIQADPGEIEFSGRSPDFNELVDFLGDSAYQRTGDEIAFYVFSWQTMQQLAANYDGIFEMEKYYEEDVQYMRALVVFAE